MKPKPDLLRAEFSEKYSFVVTSDTDYLQIKAMAALDESGDHSERLIQAFKYRLSDNYPKLYDQKHHMIQMNNNTCAIGLRIRWYHNADMLRLDEK